MSPAEAPATKTHGLISVIHQIRQASLNEDFRNELNTALTRRVRNKSEEFCFRWKRLGPGVIIGRFGSKYALVHFRGSYLEADLGDMRSANSLFGLIGRGGTLRLHVPSTKFPIHYLVDAQTLIVLSKMSNGLLNRNQTTWANAGAMISPPKVRRTDRKPENCYS